MLSMDYLMLRTPARRVSKHARPKCSQFLTASFAGATGEEKDVNHPSDSAPLFLVDMG